MTTQPNNPEFKDLGRALNDQGWLNDFKEGIANLAISHELEFIPRLTPSIPYVLRVELNKASSRGFGIDATASMDEIVETLVSEEVLDPVLALSGLRSRVVDLHVKEFSRKLGVTKFDVVAALEDYVYAPYNGPFIANERKRVKNRFGVGQEIDPQAKPVVKLLLGSLVCPPGSRPVDRGSLIDQRRSLRKFLIIGPVGQITAF